MVEGWFFRDFGKPGEQEVAEAHSLRRCPGLQFVEKFVRYIADLDHCSHALSMLCMAGACNL